MSETYSKAEPMKTPKLAMAEHKYLNWNAPSFTMQTRSEAGEQWLDTKINFLNEIMKFLPRNVTDSLTGHVYGKSGVKDPKKADQFADSVYNRNLFKKDDLWKGAQSTVHDRIFSGSGDQIDLNADGTNDQTLGRFTGLAGLPYDGYLGIGTLSGRSIDFVMDGTTQAKFQYKDEKNKEKDYKGEGEYIVPIFSYLSGKDFSKGFKEGVNFHPTVVDMQHTLANFNGSTFGADYDGDGIADGDDLTTTAITSAHYEAYLRKIGIQSPVVDYSGLYSSLMSDSLFGASKMKGLSTEGNKVYTYDNLFDQLGDGTASGELGSFLNKLQEEWNGTANGTNAMDYIPNIYEIARKGMDLSDTERWTDQDIFYLSMLMMESRRRYQTAMSTIFGPNAGQPDLKAILNKFANPEIWQYDAESQQLYTEVKTAGGSMKMVNFFIPNEVGQDISGTGLTDAQLGEIKKNAKLNWLKRRAIELQAFEIAKDEYMKGAITSLKRNPEFVSRVSEIMNGTNGTGGILEKINGTRGDGGDDDVRLVSIFGERLDKSKADSLVNRDEISPEMIRYYFEVGKIVKRRLQWEVMQDEKAVYSEIDSTSATLNGLSGSGFTELEAFIADNGTKYVQSGNGTQLIVTGIMTGAELDKLKAIYEMNGTDDSDGTVLATLQEESKENGFSSDKIFHSEELDGLSYEEFMAEDSVEFASINETNFRDGSQSIALWEAVTEMDQLNSMINNDASLAMSAALNDSDGSYWSNLNEALLAGGSSGDPAWLGTGEGVFALESRETILRQVRDAIQNLIPMYKRNSTDDVKTSVDDLFGNLATGSDLLSVLDLLVDKKSRLFKDIFQVNEFNRLNYGDVNWVYGIDGSVRNVNSLTMGGLGYFPENFKTTMNASLIHPTKRPIIDEKGGISDQESLSTQVNQLDKEYLDMILEMQKMNSFYMMLPFSSPINGLWNGTSVSAISDRNGDGTVTEADLRYNFLTPLQTLYEQVSGMERKEFTSGDMASSLSGMKAKLTGAYLKTLTHEDGTSAFDGSYYDAGQMFPAELSIADDDAIKGLIKVVFPVIDDGTASGDFSGSGTGLTLTSAGIAKIKDFKNDPLHRSGTSWPAGEPGSWIPEVKTPDGSFVGPIFDWTSGSIGLAAYEGSGQEAQILCYPLNPYIISNSTLFSKEVRANLPGMLKTFSSDELLGLLADLYDETSGTFIGKNHIDDTKLYTIYPFRSDSIYSTSYSFATDSILEDLRDHMKYADGTSVLEGTSTFQFSQTADDEFKKKGIEFSAWTDGSSRTLPPKDGNDTYSLSTSFWKPLSAMLKYFATTKLAYTSEGILSGMNDLVANDQTITDKNGTYEHMSLPVDVWSESIRTMALTVESSIVKDYEHLSRFTKGLYERMQKLDLSQILDGTTLSGGYSGGSGAVNDLFGGSGLFPNLMREIDGTRFYDFNDAKDLLEASSLAGSFLLGSTRKVITASDLGSGVTGISGTALFDIFRSYGFIGETSDERGGIPLRNISLENFPPVYAEGTSILLTSGEKETIIANFRKKYIGDALGKLYDNLSDLTQGTGDKSLSLHLKSALMNVLSNDDFIRTLEDLSTFTDGSYTKQWSPIQLSGLSFDGSRLSDEISQGIKIQVEGTATDGSYMYNRLESPSLLLRQLVYDKWKMDSVPSFSGSGIDRSYTSAMLDIRDRIFQYNPENSFDIPKEEDLEEYDNFLNYLVSVIKKDGLIQNVYTDHVVTKINQGIDNALESIPIINGSNGTSFITRFNTSGTTDITASIIFDGTTMDGANSVEFGSLVNNGFTKGFSISSSYAYEEGSAGTSHDTYWSHLRSYNMGFNGTTGEPVSIQRETMITHTWGDTNGDGTKDAYIDSTSTTDLAAPAETFSDVSGISFDDGIGAKFTVLSGTSGNNSYELMAALHAGSNSTWGTPTFTLTYDGASEAVIASETDYLAADNDPLAKAWAKGLLDGLSVDMLDGDMGTGSTRVRTLHLSKVDGSSICGTLDGSTQVIAGTGNGSMSGNLIEEFERDFSGGSASLYDGGTASAYYQAINGTSGVKAALTQTGLWDGSQDVPSLYMLLALSLERANTVTSHFETTFDAYMKYRQQIEDILTTDGSSIKKKYFSEFYMTGNFSRLMMCSDYQNRFNDAALYFGYTDGKVRNPNLPGGWYEAQGRYVSSNGKENSSDYEIDYSQTTYSQTTDLAMQKYYSSTTYKNDTYVSKATNQSLRTMSERKVADYYGQLSALDGTLWGSLGNPNYFEIVINKAALQWLDYIRDLDGTAKTSEVMELWNALIRDPDKVDGSDGTDGPLFSLVNEKTGKVNISDIHLTSFAEFCAWLNNSGVNDGSGGTLDETSKYQLYHLLKSSDWATTHVAPNIPLIHESQEMLSYEYLAVMARQMASQFNDLNEDNDKRNAEEYQELKEREDNDRYNEQVLESAAQARAARLKALGRKRRR